MAAADRIRRRLVITGHVQGVFFRASTVEVAERAGATGWVANRPDGSVEAEVQGTRGAVEAVVEFCATGPPRARVDEVEVSELEVVDGEVGFATAG